MKIQEWLIVTLLILALLTGIRVISELPKAEPNCQEISAMPEIQEYNGIEFIEVLGEVYLVKRGPRGGAEIVGKLARFYPEARR